jgi:hypothetical protein
MKRYNFRLCNKHGEEVDPLKANVGLGRVEDVQGEYIKYSEYVKFVNTTMQGMVELFQCMDREIKELSM